MTIGLAFVESSYENIHLTYIKNNILIVRQNGVSDNMYRVKLSNQLSSSMSKTHFKDHEFNSDGEQIEEVSDPLSNFDVANIINSSQSDEDTVALQILCTSILETIRFKDSELQSLLIQLPSKLFSNVENRHDKLMEILYHIKEVVI